MKKLFFISLLLALFAVQAVPGNVAGTKITGTGATRQLSTTSTPVRWVQISADSNNAADVVWGSCTVTSSTNGTPLPAGYSQFLPSLAQGGYDLAQVCVYIANNDVIYVGWSTF